MTVERVSMLFFVTDSEFAPPKKAMRILPRTVVNSPGQFAYHKRSRSMKKYLVKKNYAWLEI